MNNDTLRMLLSYAFAFAIVGGCLWFLYKAFLDPTVAALPQDQQTVFVAGMFTLMGSATTFVFGQAAAGAAARQSERASAAGVNAAMTQPPAPTLPAAPDDAGAGN